MDFAAQRATMIESQVRTNDVSDLAVQTAMRAVPREAFVPEERRLFAYAEVEHETASGRVLWKPRDFAKLAQAAALRAGDRVLVVAGGAGYAAAVFAAMGADVTVLDPDAADMPGVSVVRAPLDQPPAGGFDVVFADGGVEDVPSAWLKALAPGGRLCVIEVDGPGGRARVHTRAGDAVSARTVFDARVPVLGEFRKVRGFTF